MMTVCCKCGRHHWPGKGRCPGRPQTIGRLADDCSHMPCMSCERVKDAYEEKYYGKKKHDAKRSGSATSGSKRK